MGRASFYLIAILFAFGLKAQPSAAAGDFTQLNGDLSGLNVIRLSTENWNKYPEITQNLCPFYVEQFAKTYRQILEFSPSYPESGMLEDIGKDCRADVDNLKLPNYFYVAVEKETSKIYGLAVFEVRKPGQVYLSSWLATDYHGKRGVGSQLLSFIFKDYSEITSLELVVAQKNTATVNIYKTWGFEEDAKVDGITYVHIDMLGMSIRGPSFAKFSSRFLK